MICKILYKNTASKDVRNLPSFIQKKIQKKIELLSENPLAGKKLHGELKQFYSLRAWPYRILYEYEDQQIFIHAVEHRQSVYKT